MNKSEYVVISMDALEDMFTTIYESVGTIFTVAIYTFICLLSVFVMIEIVKYFAR